MISYCASNTNDNAFKFKHATVQTNVLFVQGQHEEPRSMNIIVSMQCAGFRTARGMARVWYMTSYYRIKNQLQHLQIQTYNQNSAHTSCSSMWPTRHRSIRWTQIKSPSPPAIAIVVYLDNAWRWDYKPIRYQTLQIWAHSNTNKLTNVHADCTEPIATTPPFHTFNKWDGQRRVVIAIVVYFEKHMTIRLRLHTLHRTPYDHSTIINTQQCKHTCWSCRDNTASPLHAYIHSSNKERSTQSHHHHRSVFVKQNSKRAWAYLRPHTLY